MDKSNYLLIDGMLRPDAIKQLYQLTEVLEIAPLYLGTRWSNIMDMGPVLVQLPSQSVLAREWHGDAAQRIDACIFHSSASLKIVAAHFRQYLNPDDYLGNSSLLRFADPLVMHHWLSSYSGEHLSQVLGPIQQLWVQPPLRGWQHGNVSPPATFLNEQPNTTSKPHFAPLGEPQLKAFENCYRWLFEERIHDWLRKSDPLAFANQTDDQIESWLKLALDSAMAWGLTCENALATWADICHDWGLDFTEQPQGPYQSWRALYPEHLQLSPELRINVLDEYRQKTRKTTDAPHDR
ncbi:hypothetical protein CU664_06660 [Pseudomonas syringae pv. actinidifoliorum]|uniref:DUF4123 domain-containing protein n=1 Tax=Pseudomonas syringae TaxID=317 RepID=UPI0013724E6B|nr:DUF4123 domain-containing protein [Pseudomonas syringae]NAS96260.1 hypothetical protein [Pseudomonas syringae pv. actinidifoliorum]NAT63001.1 hypothetical protein [Pseudomonas syringae pv. actinidifoliorum]